MPSEIASSSLIETLISAFKIRSHKVRPSPNIYQIVSFVHYQFLSEKIYFDILASRLSSNYIFTFYFVLILMFLEVIIKWLLLYERKLLLVCD